MHARNLLDSDQPVIDFGYFHFQQALEGAKHLPITAAASCFPEYYERRVFYDNL